MTMNHGQVLSQPPLDPSLLIGVPSIDNQHFALVGQLNLLINNPDALPESETFSDILHQLGDQFRSHIDSEELYLKSCGMPAHEVEEHVQAHTHILEEYAELNLALMNRKALPRFEVLLTIKNWVIDHVLLYDIGIRKYVPTQQLEQAVDV